MEKHKNIRFLQNGVLVQGLYTGFERCPSFTDEKMFRKTKAMSIKQELNTT